MQPSIFTTTIRSFFSGLFTTLGVGFGLIVIILSFASLFEMAEDTIERESYFEPQITMGPGNVRPEDADSAPVILKINIDGIIGTEKLNMQTIRQMLAESNEGTMKGRTKALFVNISTPGGSAIDADGIYRALKDYKARHNVPVWAYVDGGCLSGGMYVAAACDQVIASDVSLIGSVGVITGPFFNVTDTMKTIGVQSKTLTQGDEKDPFNPFRPWKENEGEEIQAAMKALYQQFVAIVAEARPKLTPKILETQVGARFFPAKEALDIGLIDRISSDKSAVFEELSKLAGVDPEKVIVVELEQKFWVSNFFRGRSDLLSGKMTHYLDINAKENSSLLNKILLLQR